MKLLGFRDRGHEVVTAAGAVRQVADLSVGPAPPGAGALIAGMAWLDGRPLAVVRLPLDRSAIPSAPRREARVAVLEAPADSSVAWALEIDQAAGFSEGEPERERWREDTPRWLRAAAVSGRRAVFVDVPALLEELCR